MGELQQSRFIAADQLLLLLQRFGPQHHNPPTAAHCLDVVDAIAHYANQLHNEHIITDAAPDPIEP